MIDYEDTSRERARDVVAAVLDTFVEAPIDNQGDDARVTERALTGEIAVHEERLREAEANLAKFKQDNLGYMPNEHGDYYNQLQSALANVAQTQEKLRLVSQRRDELARQVQGEEPVFGLMSGAISVRAGCAQAAQIQQLKTELAGLTVTFTDKHPRVVTLQETIGALEEQCRSATSSVAPSAAPPTEEPLEVNPVYQSLRIQLSSAEVEVVELRTQLSTFESQVTRLRADVGRITDVEAKLKQLNRDYDVVQSRHQELLRRWEDLQAKKRLDPVTSNVQFRRIEPPFAPANPVGPNRPLLLVVVLAIALGAAVVFAFTLSQLHPVFFTRDRLRRVAGLPVIGSISVVSSADESVRSRHAALACGAVYLLLLICSILAVLFAAPTATLFRSLTGADA
jgi:polysaccharide chain length determinant protein (PEP-CTERM system associated)